MSGAPVGGYLGWNEPVVVCPSCYVPMEDHPTEDCWYVDKSECPYFARWHRFPGFDPAATCSFGCVDEPECVTCGPWDHYIEVAPSAVFGPPTAARHPEVEK